MPKIANTNESPVWVTSRLHGHCVDTSALRAEVDVIGGKADVEIERLLSARERTFSRQAQKVRLYAPVLSAGSSNVAPSLIQTIRSNSDGGQRVRYSPCPFPTHGRLFQLFGGRPV